MSSSSSPRILIVGAGAVGQLFGYHLHLAGAEVSYFIKEKYLAECKQGFTLFRIGLFTPSSRGERLHFTPHALLTNVAQVAEKTWDQVWFTIPSDALQGDWFPPFIAACGEATLVCLQPGPTDRDRFEAQAPASHIVHGMIAFIAYQGPLPGEELPRGERGLVFWHPPGSPSPFGGPSADPKRLDAVLSLLRAGGCPCKRQLDVSSEAAYPTTILTPFLATLELADWKFARLLGEGDLARAAQATREAAAIMARHQGRSAPPRKIDLYRPALVRLALHAAPPIFPLPLETYLAYHFTKVGPQTRMSLREYLRLGEQYGIRAEALEELIGTLQAHDEAQSTSSTTT